jgi:hypothetical protein
MIMADQEAQEQAARAVLGVIVKNRDQALQISIEKLVEICGHHGLATDLPPLSSGLDQVWRTRLRRVLGGCLWSVDGRRWRVRCPRGGNFWIEPVRRRVFKK